MDGGERLCVRVAISGKVQGVWFRAWTQEQAGRRGLSGWVRNRRDGSVEALFDGPLAEVEAMIQSCWKGPAAAKVVAVRVDPVVPDADVVDFSILPTE